MWPPAPRPRRTASETTPPNAEQTDSCDTGPPHTDTVADYATMQRTLRTLNRTRNHPDLDALDPLH